MKSRRFIALIMLPTLIYIGFLLFYPNRDLLILWERTPPNAPALAATAALLLGYGALAWRIVQSFDGVQASRRQHLALFALVLMGGLALHIAITAMAEDDALVAIVQRTYAWKAGGYWTVGSPITNIADFIGNYAARSPTYPVHQMRHPPGYRSSSPLAACCSTLCRAWPRKWQTGFGHTVATRCSASTLPAGKWRVGCLAC